MDARTVVVDAMEAVQDDRRAAQAAGDAAAFDGLFAEIVGPLNQQFAELAVRELSGPPVDHALENRRTLTILDDGLARLASTVVAARLTRTRARAEALRASLAGDGSVTPPPSVHPDIPDRPPVAGLDNPDPPPPGPHSRFIHARRTASKTILYIDDAGREMIREGGSRSWRNNNPGNIRKGSFAEMSGSIGDDGSFAVFPDEPVGRDAIVGLLRSTSFRSLSLRDGIFRYAPPAENDSEAYVRFVVAETGVGEGEILGHLPVAKVRAIAGAIKRKEGFLPGTERSHAPTSGVAAAARGTMGGVSAAIGAAKEWMKIAEQEAALPARERSELPDPEENPRILEYFRVAAPWFETSDGDEIDWCAAFVNFCLETSGHSGTNHPGARSFFWNKNNRFIRHDHPVKGAIAVRRNAPFTDPDWETGPGHVGFVVAFTDSHVSLLGGNQDDTVCIKTFPRESRNAEGEVTAKFVAYMVPVIS